jgi:hypothetical protein
MARFTNRLNHVRIAAPCKADWEQMIGDERVRFCGQCNLNVYNLSSMTRLDAESLVARNEGRLCIRFYRRFDGSIITKDCPVGLRAIRRRVSYVAKAVSSSVLGLLAGLGVYGAVSSILPVLAPQRTMGIMVREINPREVATVGEMVVGPLSPRTPGFTMGRVLVKPIRKRSASGQSRNGASNR